MDQMRLTLGEAAVGMDCHSQTDVIVAILEVVVTAAEEP